MLVLLLASNTEILISIALVKQKKMSGARLLLLWILQVSQGIMDPNTL